MKRLTMFLCRLFGLHNDEGSPIEGLNTCGRCGCRVVRDSNEALRDMVAEGRHSD